MSTEKPEPTAADLHGKMVRIKDGREMAGFVGEAVDRHEHGWIDVDLSAVDVEDRRMVGPLGPDEVELIEPDIE